jgi:hypothetical protein
MLLNRKVNRFPKVSKVYKVPKLTLTDKLKMKYTKSSNFGARKVLTTNEENIIVKWIIEMGERGFPVTKPQIMDCVGKLIKNLERANKIISLILKLTTFC